VFESIGYARDASLKKFNKGGFMISQQVVVHLAETLGQFRLANPEHSETLGKLLSREEELKNSLFLNHALGPLARSTGLLPESLDVHDWIDHCLFGRALTIIGDTIGSYRLDLPKLNLEQINKFVEDNTANFFNWKISCDRDHKAYPLNHFFDYTGDNAFFSDATASDFEVLLAAYENHNMAIARDNELTTQNPTASTPNHFEERRLEAVRNLEMVYTPVEQEISKRVYREKIFTAERELALCPWVKDAISSLLIGKSPDPIPYTILRHLSDLNERRQEPIKYFDFDPEKIESLRRSLAAEKRDIYIAARYLLEIAQEHPGIKELIIEAVEQLKLGTANEAAV
jgi:hypothetical protein